MVLLGVILVLLAAAAGVVLVAGTAQLTDSVQIDVLGGTLSIPPLTLLITGMVVISVFWLGWALLRSGLRRSKRRRIEAKEAAAAAEARHVEEQKQMQAEFATREQALVEERRRREEAGVPGGRRAGHHHRSAGGRGHDRASDSTAGDRADDPCDGVDPARDRIEDRIDDGDRAASPRTPGRGRATARPERPRHRPSRRFGVDHAGPGTSRHHLRVRPPHPGGQCRPMTTVTTTDPSDSCTQRATAAPFAAATDAPARQSTSAPLMAGPAAASAARSAAARARCTSRTAPTTTSTPVSTSTTAATAPTVSTVALPPVGSAPHGTPSSTACAEALGAGSAPSGRRADGTAATTCTRHLGCRRWPADLRTVGGRGPNLRQDDPRRLAPSEEPGAEPRRIDASHGSRRRSTAASASARTRTRRGGRPRLGGRGIPLGPAPDSRPRPGAGDDDLRSAALDRPRPHDGEQDAPRTHMRQSSPPAYSAVVMPASPQRRSLATPSPVWFAVRPIFTLTLPGFS